MKKVLVIEDDKFIANAYRVKLTKAGFEVKMAYDGEEGLATLADFMPDLVLMDLIMPIKDGFTTLSEIRANPKYASIPVLITSNLGQKEDLDRGMQLGASGYVVKTDLSMDELVTKINLLIKK